jgi:DNA modification methylase
VIEVNAPDGRLGDRFHRWQKPLELAERLILCSTVEGARMIDPLAGTGTFLIAAAKLGRDALGCDHDPQMIEIALARGGSMRLRRPQPAAPDRGDRRRQ